MESDDYETNRNLTLMFFLEKLLDKPRSLHDLSCQFGTKGFSREMRQIAGGSQAGLRRFFNQYPSLFSLDGDIVSITTHSSSLSNGGADSRNYAQEAVQYFAARLDQYGPGTEVPIKSLLGHRSQAPPEVRHVSGQHVKEFRDFLAKHIDTFVVRDDDIIYLKKYEGCITSRLNESNGQVIELEPAPKLDPHITNQLLSTIREHLESFSEEMTIRDLFEQVMPKLEKVPSFGKGIPIKRQQDLVTFLKMHSHLFKVSAGMVSLIPIPVQSSGHTLSSSSPTKSIKSSEIQNQQQTLKQRVNSVVLKVLADNSDRDKTSPTPDDGAWRTNVFQRSKLVSSYRDALTFMQEIMRRGEAIAVTFEGINLSSPSKGQVTLVQVGTMAGQAYLFDVITDPKIWNEGQLKAVLQCNDVCKVFHDCRNISALLSEQYATKLCHVFDTQAAHAVLEMQENGKPIHKVKNESLNALCDLYGSSVNPIKDQLKAVYRKDPRFWARRPLSADMVIFAAADVLCLVPEIYLAMKRAIKPEFANLFKELCDEQVLSNIDLEGVKSKKKQRKLDFEVSELRLKIATSHGKNIVLSNREIRLLRHVELTEEDKERLRGSYKVAKKLEKLEGKQRESEDDDSDNNELELPSLESVGSSDISWNASRATPLLLQLPSTPPTTKQHPLQSYSSSRERLFTPCSSESGSNSEVNSQPASLTDSMALVNKILADGNLDRVERIEKLEAILTDVTSMALGSRSSSSHNLNGSSAKVDATTQTISTGDISITKVYSPSKSSPLKETAAGPGQL